jgi:2-polyprenyl-3-methyl-5-hydroxy-6-metoxy-1,4-benzoquinol methylase
MAGRNHQSFSQTVCPLCGCTHLKPILYQRPDYEYDVAVGLSYAACQDPVCGLVFAVDIPPVVVIQSFYTKYSTHNQYRPLKIASIIELFGLKKRERYLRSIFQSTNISRLNVLDYGCGAGDFMRQLKMLGVGGVVGYDFDPEACACAREQGLTAFFSESEFRAAGPYDCIFFNHVVEHLADPVAVLAAQALLLKPGGRLVIRTPNCASFLARLFGSRWRGWETPRHLHIFNTQSIQQLMVRVDLPQSTFVRVATSNAMFTGMFHESFHAAFWRASVAGKLLRHMACIALLPIAYVANALWENLGEEVAMVIEKRETL